MKQRENKRLKTAALPLATALVKNHLSEKNKKTTPEVPKPQKYTSFSDDDALAYWQKQIGSVEAIERHFDHAVQKFLINNVLQKVVANLQTIIDTHKGATWQKKSVEKLVEKDLFSAEDEDELVNEAMINLEPILQNAGVISGQDANKLIQLELPYIPSEQLRKRIQDNVDKFTRSMVDTDQEHLTNLIAAGIENGDSIPVISNTLKTDFAEYSKMQATRITRTEVLRSANQATLDAFKQSGVVEGKQWLTAGAVDECANYDGKIETLGGNFYDQTSEFLDGDPPLHPNCRCVLIPVLSE